MMNIMIENDNVMIYKAPNRNIIWTPFINMD